MLLCSVTPLDCEEKVTCEGGCHLGALEDGVREQPGDKVLALALPDQVDVLDLIVASLSNSFVSFAKGFS